MIIESIKKELNGKYGMRLTRCVQLPIRKTCGYLTHYCMEDKNKGKYMLALATNDYQAFKLGRSNIMCEACKNYFTDTDIHVKPPIGKGYLSKYRLRYEFYRYLEDTQAYNDITHVTQVLYSKYLFSEKVRVDDKLLIRIENQISEDVPEETKNIIKGTWQYKKYLAQVKRYDNIIMSVTHGDFSPPNLKICKKNSELYLFDFEQGYLSMPIGYDLFHYYQYLGSNYKVPYYELNNTLWELRHIPLQEIGLEIYVPKINCLKEDKHLYVCCIEECNEKIVIEVNGNEEYCYVDLMGKYITPYAQWLLIDNLLNRWKIIHISNCLWDTGQLVLNNRTGYYDGKVGRMNNLIKFVSGLKCKLGHLHQ